MEMKKATIEAQILRRAAEIIRERGWCQGSYESRTGGACAAGALYVAAGDDNSYVSSAVILSKEVANFAEKLDSIWRPAWVYCMDVALREGRYRLIEVNNLNSAGFYTANMSKLVQALEDAYSVSAPPPLTTATPHSTPPPPRIRAPRRRGASRSR